MSYPHTNLETLFSKTTIWASFAAVGPNGKACHPNSLGTPHTLITRPDPHLPMVWRGALETVPYLVLKKKHPQQSSLDLCRIAHC